MKYRLVHNQNTAGVLLITDIDSGLTNAAFGIYRKQSVYLPKHKTFFNSDRMVEVDKSTPGFIDLVPSDLVELSVARGVIKGLSDNDFLDIVVIPTGALAAPTIASAGQDNMLGVGGDITITGKNFLSFNPDTTTVTITDGTTTVVVDQEDFDTHTATEIVITGHGLDEITQVTLTSNGQDVTSPVVVDAP